MACSNVAVGVKSGKARGEQISFRLAKSDLRSVDWTLTRNGGGKEAPAGGDGGLPRQGL
jgi:hypothetical protein